MKLRSLFGILTMALALGLERPTHAQEVQVSLGRPSSGVSASFGLRRGRPYGVARIGYGRSYGRSRTWVAGCYVDRRQKVWIDGYRDRVWDEPIYETRYDDCGNRVQVLIRAGCWRWVDVPGRWEWRTNRVWQPGHWSYRARRGR